MLVTLDGIEILVKEIQFANAESPMLVTLAGIVIVESPPQAEQISHSVKETEVIAREQARRRRNKEFETMVLRNRRGFLPFGKKYCELL